MKQEHQQLWSDAHGIIYFEVEIQTQGGASIIVAVAE